MSQRCRTSSHFTKNSVSKICEDIEGRNSGDQRRTRLSGCIFWSLGLIRKSSLSEVPSFGTTYLRSVAPQSAGVNTCCNELDIEDPKFVQQPTSLQASRSRGMLSFIVQARRTLVIFRLASPTISSNR